MSKKKNGEGGLNHNLIQTIVVVVVSLMMYMGVQSAMGSFESRLDTADDRQTKIETRQDRFERRQRTIDVGLRASEKNVRILALALVKLAGNVEVVLPYTVSDVEYTPRSDVGAGRPTPPPERDDEPQDPPDDRPRPTQPPRPTREPEEGICIPVVEECVGVSG